MKYEKLIRTLVCPFVSHCESIQVTEREFARCLYITLSVHRTDHGKVIGSKGRMVQAITALILTAGKRNKDTIHFELLEPHVGEKEDEPIYQPDPNWNRDMDTLFTEKIRPVVEAVVGDVGLMVSSDGRSTMVGFVKPVDPLLLGAFGTLFRAVGKSLGREVLLNAKESSHARPAL